MHFYALPNYLVPAAMRLAARPTQLLGLALMLAKEEGGRRKKEEEGGLAAFIKNLQTLTWQVGKNHLYKHNKTTSLQNNISPNETPHKQTIVSSNICFQTKNVKSKTR